MSKLLSYILVIFVLLAIGFFVGRTTLDNQTVIKYVKGETLRDTVLKPVPYCVYTPSKPDLPTRVDTIRLHDTMLIARVIDTAMIIAEYIKRKDYSKVFFDSDSLGKLVVNATVQYNDLQRLGYEFTPITKQVTTYKTKLFSPYLGAGFGLNGDVELNGGMFIKELGIGAKYNGNFGLILLYKF